jgi:hypothetical protein
MTDSESRRCPHVPVRGICLICGALAMAAVPFLQAQAGQPAGDFLLPVFTTSSSTSLATETLYVSVPDTIRDGVEHTAPSPRMWTLVRTTPAGQTWVIVKTKST